MGGFGEEDAKTASAKVVSQAHSKSAMEFYEFAFWSCAKLEFEVARFLNDFANVPSNQWMK
jgi:hypothetical protein